MPVPKKVDAIQAIEVPKQRENSENLLAWSIITEICGKRDRIFLLL